MPGLLPTASVNDQLISKEESSVLIDAMFLFGSQKGFDSSESKARRGEPEVNGGNSPTSRYVVRSQERKWSIIA